ncbi:hypothetical protein, variant 1 [Aphanomyces invadans]|uniref:Uncharacterized protein n=1 Tax=Aphanomyces invadans TaxID=157072 RepID=A0A024U731_9STRA|nr:hypothetical protein, variant 1 [Aphanomyces invadans]ETW01702.1 hypothetical protein, variant 1 [Aphanomyces invadans]|eukprot:XP_008869550.1 hypothetical protein, variant 1 [Aphanomyces invadans]
MAQLHCAVAVAKWLDHVKRRRESHRLTLAAVAYARRGWFQRWSRTHRQVRATCRLSTVQNQVLLRRILTSWARYRLLARVVVVALKHVHTQLVKAILAAWKHRTDVLLKHAAAVVAIEDWLIQRHLAQWRARTKTRKHHRTLYNAATSFNIRSILHDALRRLETAAYAQCKRLAKWIGWHVKCQPVWRQWVGVHKLQSKFRRWAAYARHCRWNLRVTGRHLRLFREGQGIKRQILTFRLWCQYVDTIAAWRCEYMAAKRTCLVDVVTNVRKRKLAHMYDLYRRFHAFCERATHARRAADWFLMQRTGRRCLKAWWRVVLVRKQTQLLRVTQAMAQTNRKQGTARAFGSTTSYAVRQREIKDVVSSKAHLLFKQAHPVKQSWKSPPKYPALPPKETPSSSSRAWASPLAKPRSPLLRTIASHPMVKPVPVVKPKVRSPDKPFSGKSLKVVSQQAITRDATSRPTMQGNPNKLSPQLVSPETSMDVMSQPASPAMHGTVETGSGLESPMAMKTRNRPTEALSCHNQAQDLDKPDDVACNVARTHEPATKHTHELPETVALCGAEQPTERDLTFLNAIDASSTQDDIVQVENSHETNAPPTVMPDIPDLIALACEDDTWQAATLDTAPVRRIKALSATPPAPVASGAIIAPDVTWNECILELLELYSTFRPIPALPMASQVAVYLFDCVRLLGWMYNDFSFKQSKRCLLQAKQSCPSESGAVDVTWLCQSLNLVAAHRASLEVDVFTKAQLHRFAHIDRIYAAMPALAPCLHLKRLLFYKRPPTPLLHTFATPQAMLCEPVLTLVEKHTKFFRALFLSPSLKKRTTTGAMLRHLVMSKTDFLDMAKAANIFPTFFTRRELLSFFHQSSSMEDVLTFPEFIECLFRCSERFFTVGNDDDGGEVRFQALVMAMDGYGSILQVMIALTATSMECLDCS